MRARRRVFRHASGRGPARPWWASPLFRVEDEGDDRNDARVAHARPIVAQNHASWPCGQMLPRRRDRAGTGRWRSMGGSRSSALPAPRSRPCLPPSPIQGKFGLQSGPHYTLTLAAPGENRESSMSCVGDKSNGWVTKLIISAHSTFEFTYRSRDLGVAIPAGHKSMLSCLGSWLRGQPGARLSFPDDH